jgi:hypothetical protein
MNGDVSLDEGFSVDDRLDERRSISVTEHAGSKLACQESVLRSRD